MDKPVKERGGKIYTVVVATQTLNKARRNDNFKSTLIKTAMQAIEQTFDENFDWEGYSIISDNFKDKDTLKANPTSETKLDNPVPPQHKISTTDVNKISVPSEQLKEQIDNTQQIDNNSNFLTTFIESSLISDKHLKLINDHIANIKRTPSVPFTHVEINSLDIDVKENEKISLPALTVEQTLSHLVILFHTSNVDLSTFQFYAIKMTNSIEGHFKSERREYIFHFNLEANIVYNQSQISSLPSNLSLVLKKEIPSLWNTISVEK